MRYVGLEIPPDDVNDWRLRQPNVAAILSYASETRVIREALVTCETSQQAQLLRSYADVTRVVALEEGRAAVSMEKGQAWTPPIQIKLSLSQNCPPPANTLEVFVSVLGDDLDLAHAQLAAQMPASMASVVPGLPVNERNPT
jgi:hypothetical protein